MPATDGNNTIVKQIAALIFLILCIVAALAITAPAPRWDR